jgi:hypothetical protein
MTRLTTLGIVGALSASLFAFTTGCSGTPPGEFIIYQNQVPAADCSIPATVGALYQGVGHLDVRLLGGPHGYQFFPLLQNNFPPPAGGQLVDANRIQLQGFDVDVDVLDPTLTDPIASLITGYRMADPTDPNHALVQFSQVTSGSVASGSGDTSSIVEIVPSGLASQIRSLGVLSQDSRYTLMVTVRARGTTQVSSVRSDPFRYPVELCDGCLMIDQGACPVTAVSGNTCYVGQDSSTGCCEQNGSLFCPSTVSSK